MLKETEQDRESGTKQEPGQAVAPSEQAEKLAVWLVILRPMIPALGGWRRVNEEFKVILS